ncbi:hypothetical protein VNO78_30892 [Psophocarpus tetragonolobus]|uniref:Ubiquitin fusion degradaton protein n=1 Tax=Psophocarpus tetragonolobus TaxID=3891 RepID=A0AAN9RXG1_PSOTE
MQPTGWDEEESHDNGWNEEASYYNEWDATFQDVYRCYPLSSTEVSNLENGGKIIMPDSALNLLAYCEIEYPMLFELRKPSAERVTHCGVLEFTADEGMIYMPQWMMENMHLQEGDNVILRSANVPRATYVKLQPHTKDFLDLYNIRSILEYSLRSFSCLTTGDTIMISFNKKKYYIDVVETKPSHAVSIIETDCEVDFAQPLDYTEPEKQLPCASSHKGNTEAHDDSAKKTAQIIPFSGSGRRLDSKPCTQSVQEISSSMLKDQQTETETKNLDSNSRPSRRKSGKLVFGSDANASKIQSHAKASLESTNQESSQNEELPKFQAFTGKKYSLRN